MLRPSCENCSTRSRLVARLAARLYLKAARQVSARSLRPTKTSGDRLGLVARDAYLNRESFQPDETIWSEYIPARCGLFVFGAGDDAKPLVTQASTLGWHITVADGRSHLATRPRFPRRQSASIAQWKYRRVGPTRKRRGGCDDTFVSTGCAYSQEPTADAAGLPRVLGPRIVRPTCCGMWRPNLAAPAGNGCRKYTHP